MELEHLLRINGEWTWSAILLFTLFLTFILKLLLKWVSLSLGKVVASTPSAWDDIGLDILKGLKSPVLFIWSFYFLSKSLTLPEYANRLILLAVVVASIFQVSFSGLYLMKKWRELFLNRRIEEDPSVGPALGLLYLSCQVAFIVTIVLIGLSNLGVNIGTLLAGLGVGGIALALAAQNILGDLLASLSILLDKPFVVGDHIMVENQSGKVEYIGIKSTRVRSLSGEQLIFSNKHLLESRIHNYKRMWQRRVVHKISISYATRAEILEVIPRWIQDIVEAQEPVKFERCHFAQCASSSLDFELVFWINSPNYIEYMDLQQKILVGIFKKFGQEKVEFTYPKQVINIESERQIKI